MRPWYNIKALCEKIGLTGAITHKRPGKENYSTDYPMPTHNEAIALVLKLLTDPELGVIKSVDEISAVGHRFAHGGKLSKSCILGCEELKYIESIIPINPLHGPPAIAGIKACLKLMPEVTQVAVFDTSFYSDIEDFRYVYPIPYEYYEKYQVRRYGFHGTSHRYVAGELAKQLGKPIEDLKIITCHLGNGSSITAIKGGKAIDTSMGFTPQEGVVMGTRSGNVDPTVPTYLMKTCGYTAQEMEDILNKKSGLLGISGLSNDCRNITAAAKEGNYRASLALKIMTNGIKKIIGSYVAELNGLDALVFTAGIGENQVNIRKLVCEDMSYLGIEIDEERNENFTRGIPFDITKEGARVATWIIPTDEEYAIAMDTQRLASK